MIKRKVLGDLNLSEEDMSFIKLITHCGHNADLKIVIERLGSYYEMAVKASEIRRKLI